MSNTELGPQVVPINIEDEMRTAYLDYSMSVIIGRALPDVRDGLKPVHRRILYAMYGEGLLSNRKYSKCAGVVGEVLKKYHPHGDSAVYDSLVRMAQPWNLRYPLVDGQGNFGSPDGDSAAAYRYTECRMRKLAEELLRDIDKETADFHPNFDGQHLEPGVLPSAFPNLLVNGSEGIAVGMATKIPPHNLGEIIDAVVELINDPETPETELLGMVPGPDFPTGGIIHGRTGIRDAYLTGRGRVVIRARSHIEEIGSREAIIVDELPYQVGADRVLNQIAKLVREKRIDGIAAIRDESDRRGRRVVIECKRDAYTDIVLNKLYKHTDLQTTFGVILLAIVNNQPRVLSLKQMLGHYVAHRRDVVTRRSRYLLRKAQERAHILEGYRIALDHIDAIIALIRSRQTTEEARVGLMEQFGLSEIQARNILEMQLRRLTGMEREKIEGEYAEILETIAYLDSLLGNDALLMQVVKDELLVIREKFTNERKTEIVDAASDIDILDLIAAEDQAITLTVAGYIKRTPLDLYREQRRGGFGTRGIQTKEEDEVREIFIANTHAKLLIFTTSGQSFAIPVYRIPEGSRTSRGKPIVNLVELEQDDTIAAVLTINDYVEDLDLLFCSRKGLVKRTRLSEFKNMRRTGLRAYDCAEGDILLSVLLTSSDAEVFVCTKKGQSIRFPGLDRYIPSEDMTALSEIAQGPVRIGGSVKEDGLDVDEASETGRFTLVSGETEVRVEGVAPAAVRATAMVVIEGEVGEDGVVHSRRVTPWQPRRGARHMGRVARGVWGIRLQEDDEIASMNALNPDLSILTVTENGYGKQTPSGEYRQQSRGGKGIRAHRVTDKTGIVVGALQVEPEDRLMIITDSGRVIKIPVVNIRTTESRASQGVKVMRVDDGERIVSIARVDEDPAEE